MNLSLLFLIIFLFLVFLLILITNYIDVGRYLFLNSYDIYNLDRNKEYKIY